MEKSKIASLQNELTQIIAKPIEVINLPDFLDQNQIPKGKRVFNIETSLMFVDIRNSTDMTDELGRKNMVKIYQMYTTCCRKAVQEYSGRVLQVVGDGLLCSFVGDANMTSGRKAVDAAITIQTYIVEAMNEVVEEDWEIECGIGIMTGHVYANRMKIDKNHQVVYPSSITNYASKLCTEAMGGDIIFDEKTYMQLDKETKDLCIDYENDLGEFHKLEGVTWKIE